jgi:hypothetical protein
MKRRFDPHGDHLRVTIDLRSIGLRHVERNAMSTLARRLETVHRWDDPPLTRVRDAYFLLGQNARGQWVIRENTGRKAGVFRSRAAALRFARLESPSQQFTVVHVNDIIEFDYAAPHL